MAVAGESAREAGPRILVYEGLNMRLWTMATTASTRRASSDEEARYGPPRPRVDRCELATFADAGRDAARVADREHLEYRKDRSQRRDRNGVAERAGSAPAIQRTMAKMLR